MLQAEILKNYRYNFTVNVLDGAFFGLGLGFVSFTTILPLFVATLTDSTVLIGLIGAIHTIGWQLPQLITANRVSRLRRYKPMTLFLTVHERWPFWALALVAWFAPTMNRDLALLLTFGLVMWHSIGGGLTATSWQSLIGKIIPPRRHGFFYGTQSAAANLLASGGVYVAGLLIHNLNPQLGFAISFFLAGSFMMFSMGFLAKSREPESPPKANEGQRDTFKQFTSRLLKILRKDGNFRWFLWARIAFQITLMATAFYTIYVVRHFELDEQTAGVVGGSLGAVLALAQTVANPILGWMGDRWSHRQTFAVGALLAAGGTLLAMVASDLGLFYVVFMIAGVGNVFLWAIAMSMTLEFGTEEERPYYIGLSNTLVAPATLIAVPLGGWLADSLGFGATFLLAAVCGLISAFILQFLMRDPVREALSL